MKKQIYERPDSVLWEVSLEGNFLASDPWYTRRGEGNFDYVVEEDETWG